MIKVAEDVTFCVSFRLGLGTTATAQKRQGNVEFNLGCCAACLLAYLPAVSPKSGGCIVTVECRGHATPDVLRT